MKTKQEFIATATHSQTHGRIEFTGTEALTELLGRFGSGRLVHLYADAPQKADAELGDLPEAQRELMAENKRLTTERSEDEVLAETDRYRAEVERLTTERDAWKSNCEDQITLLNKIADERDALKADAERYRWLRTCNNDSHVIYGDTQNCELMMEEVLDAAIDAAIAKEQA